MHILTQFVIVVTLAVIAGALLSIASAIRELSRTIATKRLFNRRKWGTEVSCTSVGPKPTGGFAIYMYRQGRWHLEADLSTPGCEVSPPEAEGAFDGQVVRKQAVPR
ncbi:MAG: hypothetical protein R3C59_28625 [Planctomycetaceae bacterium]